MHNDARLFLYCDEAGHTGIDLCGLEQPFFISAGFAFREEQIDSARSLVAAHLAEFNKECGSTAIELKSSSLVGSVRGRKRIAALIRQLEQMGGIPIVVAIEKRFSLGGRFVDDYLDLADNPRAGPQFCTDRDLKRAAATAIGRSSDAALRAIELALREPSLETRRAAVSSVVDDLRGRGEEELAYVAEGILTSRDGLLPQADSDLGYDDFAASNAPNATALYALVVAVDQYAREHGIGDVRLIHDETPHMEGVLSHFVWVGSDKAAHERMANTPLLETAPRVECVSAPEFVRSENELLIQAADVLAGGIAYYLKRAYRGDDLDASSREIAQATITMFLDGRVPNAGAVFSDDLDWLGRLGKQLDWGTLRRPARAREPK